MAKIYMAPQSIKKVNLFFNLILFLIVVSTILTLIYVINEYKRQFSLFESLKISYEEQVLNEDIEVDNSIQKNIDIDQIDKVMQSRPEAVFFDRIRLSKQALLQVEGITNNPEDVESIVKNAQKLGLELKIYQVKQDNEKNFIFELK